MIISDSARLEAAASSEDASVFSSELEASGHKPFASLFASALSQGPQKKAARGSEDIESISFSQDESPGQAGPSLEANNTAPKFYAPQDFTSGAMFQDALSKMNFFVDGADAPPEKEQDLDLVAEGAERTDPAPAALLRSADSDAPGVEKGQEVAPSSTEGAVKVRASEVDTEDAKSLGAEVEKTLNAARQGEAGQPSFAPVEKRQIRARAEQNDIDARVSRGAEPRGAGGIPRETPPVSSENDEHVDAARTRDDKASIMEQMMYTLMMEGGPVASDISESLGEDLRTASFASEAPEAPGDASSATTQRELRRGDTASPPSDETPTPTTRPQSSSAQGGETPERVSPMPAKDLRTEGAGLPEPSVTPDRQGRLAPLESGRNFASRMSALSTATETQRAETALGEATSPSSFLPIDAERAVDAPLTPRVMAVDDLHQGLAEVVAQGTDHIQLRVAPPGLGALNIDVRLENGEVRLHVVGSAPELETHLNANLQGLRHELETRGLSLGEMTFSSTQNFDLSQQTRSFDGQADDRRRERAYFEDEAFPRSAATSVPGRALRPRTQRIDVII